MSRLNPIAPEDATGRAGELLGLVKQKLGLVPNMARAMANAPSVLEGYLLLGGALSKGALPPKVREQIALAVGEANGCEYCVSAHSAIGRSLGLTAEQIRDSRLGFAVDPKADALVRLSRKVVETRGLVSDEDLEAARDAGVDDSEIAEVVGHVALNVLTNYFNHLAGTDIDFPRAAPLSGASPEAVGAGV